MAKHLVLGNGNILICLDKNGFVKDFYFPHVGLENHTGNYCKHRIGIWVDEKFSWLDDKSWEIQIEYEKEKLLSNICYQNSQLEISIKFNDLVYNEKNIFIRRAEIQNLSSRKRFIKIFFNQEFQIYGSSTGNTAFYDPLENSIIHYKGKRVFLVNAKFENTSFDDYTTGVFGSEGKEGSYIDAQDGQLSKNPVEYGCTDSIISLSLNIDSKSSKKINYWIACGKSIKEVHDLNIYVLQKTPDYLINTTSDFWYAWVNKENNNFGALDHEIISLFKKSLLIIRSHIDNNGIIISSGDSDMMLHGKDSYAYMWPRDAVFTAIALDKAGDYNATQRFFTVCSEIISDEGYFFHKYSSDKSLGSSWHPWIQEGDISLPIQEDETALVISSLWKHYETTRDLEYIESIYNILIKKATDFMLFYRDIKTGLPQPSYDLWEEKLGISTFTSTCVYDALISCSEFAKLLGKKDIERKCNQAALEVKEAILKNLYNADEGSFYRMINIKNGNIIYDTTLDLSSAYGVFKFNVLNLDDERLVKAMKHVENRLFCKTDIGGYIRRENDTWFQVKENAPENPWIITTLWMAQYYIAKANSQKDLEKALSLLKWTASKALPSGLLSEQIDPYTGKQLSAIPLIWSHAEFVTTVLEYIDKLKSLKP